MRRAGLIAINVVREQRWFLLLMLVYIIGITALLYFVEKDENDILVVFKQEAVYGTLFSIVIAASLFQNERKTRRIIAVLSKAVSRGEYVAGMIVGVNLTTVLFYAVVFASFFVLFPPASAGGAVVMMVHMLVASLLASVVTVFYTTFLHPLIATAVAGLTLASPLLLEKLAGAGWTRVLPVVALIKEGFGYTLGQPPATDWTLLSIALLECVALWLAAAWIFGLRDITTAVE